MKQKQKKEIELPMEYNPGLHKYEPILPMKKTKRKLKIEVDWKWVVWTIISVILAIVLLSILFNIFVK